MEQASNVPAMIGLHSIVEVETGIGVVVAISISLVDAEEGKDRHYDNDEANKINDTVHSNSPEKRLPKRYVIWRVSLRRGGGYQEVSGS